jgi:hypothetical protein
MIRFFAVTLMFTTALCASAAAGQEPADKARAALTIPKDAVANADGTWSYTDKQGKRWTYSNTPLGVMREPAGASADAKLPAGLPAGATRNANGSFSWTDAKGKKWVYARTPLGFSRMPAPSVSDWKVTDKGDTVRFERPGPMGATVWEKKKTDLTDEERSALELQKTTSKTARPE